MSRAPRTRILTTGALLAAAALAAPAAAQADCAHANAEPGTVRASTAETAVRCLVNEERRERDLTRLGKDGRLTATAGRYSDLLVRERFFAHRSPGGSTPVSRIRRTGYLSGVRRWTVGENLAWGERHRGTPKSLVRAWMNSRPHRANVLGRSYREIGVGITSGSPRGGGRDAWTLSASFGLAVAR